MTISLLKITNNDIDFIKDLETKCGLSYWSKNDYLEELDRKDSVNLILLKDGIKCGFLIARLIKTESATEAEIYNIGIVKSRRNHNLGTMLLEKLIAIGTENKLRTIFLEVRKSNNPAITFYRKNNFIEIGKRRNFYSNPTEDAILMSRAVDS